MASLLGSSSLAPASTQRSLRDLRACSSLQVQPSPWHSRASNLYNRRAAARLHIACSSDNGVTSTREQVITDVAPGSVHGGTATSSSSSTNGSSSEQPQAAATDDASLLGPLATELSEDEKEEAGGSGTPLVASLGVLGGILLLMGGGYVFREPIKLFLGFFINAVDEWGPLGYLAYALVYTGLEVLAVPAIPLTMTAGVIFGPIPGTAIVSVSATLAATIAFLIARYAARDRVAALAAKNKRFAAIDRAISKNGFKFVVLLRLSPLLPLAASNYLYGLTSVDLGRYVLGSWLGMLPGTYAYVTAGHVGKAVLTKGEGAISLDSWHLGLALGATLLALGFVGRLATQAVEEADAEALAEEQAKEARRAARAAARAAAAAAGGQQQQQQQQRNGAVEGQ